MPGIPEPLVLEKNGARERFPSIRNAWLTRLRSPQDSDQKIGQRNREKVRLAIDRHTQINGYYIYYAE
jgi:hypothetical protein